MKFLNFFKKNEKQPNQKIKIWHTIILDWILDNLYLILLSYSIAFIVFYLFYKFNTNLNLILSNYDEPIKLFKDLSILTFSAGIFTVASKQLHFLKVFKKEFNEVIAESEFNNKMKEMLSSITFSEEFLTKQDNLYEIWKTVTLVKYKKEFPELYNKIEKKLNNDFFEKNSLKQYYKYLQISYNFQLLEDDKTILIKEVSSFTIVRNTTEKFDWEFFVSVSTDEKNLLKKEGTKINNVEIDLDKCPPIKSTDNLGYYQNKYTYELENSYEYNIERAFEFKQNIEEDRVASYSSTNVIDTLTVRINLCNKLNAVFEPSSYDPYIKESSFDNGLCYTSRGILFPGEKFKVFIFRKNGI